MIQPFFDFIDKFVTDFTWKRTVIVFSILALTVFVFYGYELNTNSSLLSKYERSIAILEKLETIELKSQESKEIKKQIYIGLNEVISPSQILLINNDFNVHIPIPLEQALYTALPWLFFSIFFVFRNEDRKSSFKGAISMAMFMGTIGYFTAIGFEPIENSAYIPILLNSILVIVALVYKFVKDKPAVN